MSKPSQVELKNEIKNQLSKVRYSYGFVCRTGSFVVRMIATLSDIVGAQSSPRHSVYKDIGFVKTHFCEHLL